jgi:hypothetical protein
MVAPLGIDDVTPNHDLKLTARLAVGHIAQAASGRAAA